VFGIILRFVVVFVVYGTASSLKSKTLTMRRGSLMLKTRLRCLRGRAGVALLVAASGAGGADDNHATALATVLEGRHDDGWML
jgi:hypothetical protein